ncbi:MAG: hypothetical protein O2894_13990, partial [Planctomycetota bacterium]|nr:hypothetical protein [Planctomycetota bacterium]
SGPPTSGFAPVTPRGPEASSPSATEGAAGVQGSRVLAVSKTHNVPLDAGPGAEPDLALQLDVDYEVRGQAGRNVYVAIWFARVREGSLVRSALPAYGDREGNVTLQTRSAAVASDASRYRATLRIPYRAFPMSAGEASYDVEARVQILRVENGERVSMLCRGSTTFRVYGYEEGAEPAPAAPAVSEAREDGTIWDE